MKSLDISRKLQELTHLVLHLDVQVPKDALLYEERPGGFKCRTCKWAIPTKSGKGDCPKVRGPIDLADGCCIAYKEQRT